MVFALLLSPEVSLEQSVAKMGADVPLMNIYTVFSSSAFNGLLC